MKLSIQRHWGHRFQTVEEDVVLDGDKVSVLIGNEQEGCGARGALAVLGLVMVAGLAQGQFRAVGIIGPEPFSAVATHQCALLRADYTQVLAGKAVQLLQGHDGTAGSG